MNVRTRWEILKRLFDSINYIEAHLNEPVSVHDVAQASGYSTYHFSRFFRALVGDTPKEYLRKRRLTVAAGRLAKGEESILDLALDCQFESQEAFTRSFKQHFKTTPGQYRRNADPFRFLYKEQFSPHMLSHLKKNLAMEPEIVTRPKTNAVGIATRYTEAELDYATMWMPFAPHAERLAHRVGSHFFGIYEEYEEEEDDVGFTYVCAMEVENFDNVPEGMVTRTLPEQLYAVFRHDDEAPSIPQTMKYIWGSWLPKSKYEYSERPDFELFPKANEFGSHKPIHLHVPIREK